MTRINCNISPKILMDQHLMAEYRELPMVYASLSRSLRSRSIDNIIRQIPSKFTLNSGHVTFFYDKLNFLQNRYLLLIEELKARKYNLDPNRVYPLDHIPKDFKNDAHFTKADHALIKERILSRIGQKPDWYRYYGEKIDIKDVYDRYSEI